MEIETGTEKTNLLNRLRRIEGQVRGVQRMIEEAKPCDDIVAQLSATKAALDRVSILIIAHRMRECLTEEEQADANTAIEQALQTYLKYAHSVR
jgi:DNA-binding FrmR family transcriptional regulator